MKALNQDQYYDLRTDTVTLEDKIRLRAYELYLERGREPGCDIEDWLQAEREIEGGSQSAQASAVAAN